MSAKMEEIQKALDMYLESKRQVFPRFYFLSNDDVLEILGQSLNPEAMQPHMKKCFDNIKYLRIEKARTWIIRGICIYYNTPLQNTIKNTTKGKQGILYLCKCI